MSPRLSDLVVPCVNYFNTQITFCSGRMLAQFVFQIILSCVSKQFHNLGPLMVMRNQFKWNLELDCNHRCTQKGTLETWTFCICTVKTWSFRNTGLLKQGLFRAWTFRHVFRIGSASSNQRKINSFSYIPSKEPSVHNARTHTL